MSALLLNCEILSFCLILNCDFLAFQCLRLYDVGSSELRLEAPSKAPLLDCCFQDESVAFISGSDGFIRRSAIFLCFHLNPLQLASVFLVIFTFLRHLLLSVEASNRCSL